MRTKLPWKRLWKPVCLKSSVLPKVKPNHLRKHLLWQYPAKMLNPRIHGPHTMSADDFLKGIPLGRFCNARDIGNAAVFLLSGLAAGITAEILHVDAGFNVAAVTIAGDSGV